MEKVCWVTLRFRHTENPEPSRLRAAIEPMNNRMKKQHIPARCVLLNNIPVKHLSTGNSGMELLAVIAMAFSCVWVQDVCRVFELSRICVKHSRLPGWWMLLFVAQVRRHPWWDRPAVHHSCLSFVAPLHTSIYSLPPFPAVHDEWPIQQMCEAFYGHFFFLCHKLPVPLFPPSSFIYLP